MRAEKGGENVLLPRDSKGFERERALILKGRVQGMERAVYTKNLRKKPIEL